jgi:hypothetical protein
MIPCHDARSLSFSPSFGDMLDPTKCTVLPADQMNGVALSPGLSNRLIVGGEEANRAAGPIECRKRLGGIPIRHLQPGWPSFLFFHHTGWISKDTFPDSFARSIASEAAAIATTAGTECLGSNETAYDRNN